MCQCDTDAPAWGFCMRKTISLFIWDGTYQWDRMYVLDGTYRQKCCYMQGHKNQQMTKITQHAKKNVPYSATLSWADPQGGQVVRTPPPPLENHKLLYVCFEIWVWTPLQKQLDPFKKQLDPFGSNCFLREVLTALCEIF